MYFGLHFNNASCTDLKKCLNSRNYVIQSIYNPQICFYFYHDILMPFVECYIFVVLFGALWLLTFISFKVTGPESLEVSWRPPEQPNGVITGYELCRDGEVIYVGTGTHYHDFTLSPSFDYSYIVRANNSKGVVSSTATTAKTHPSAPSGLGPPTLRPLGASQVNLLSNDS